MTSQPQTICFELQRNRLSDGAACYLPVTILSAWGYSVADTQPTGAAEVLFPDGRCFGSKAGHRGFAVQNDDGEWEVVLCDENPLTRIPPGLDRETRAVVEEED